MSEKLFELYRELLNTRFADGRSIFDRITPNDLCVAGHHQGGQYDIQDNKLIIYGQAVNGWQNGSHIYSEGLVHEVLSRADDPKEMRMMADCRGWHGAVNGEPAKYYYKTSKFWKLNYQVISSAIDPDFQNFYVPYQAGSDYDSLLDNTWAQEIVWSNLYKAAFTQGGNPDSKIMNATNEICRKIVLHEIAEFKPKRILFNTGENMFTYMFLSSDWEGKENLILQKSKDDGNVRYVGQYEYAPGETCKIVVCRRPDEWKVRYKNNDIAKEAEEILSAFNRL